MGTLDILEKLKGKVLEIKDFEILKHTYQMQENNLKELKENKQLWQEKAERFQKENDELSRENVDLRARVASDEFIEGDGYLIKKTGEKHSKLAYCPGLVWAGRRGLPIEKICGRIAHRRRGRYRTRTFHKGESRNRD